MHIEPRMERIKLLVIATVIGALGLFGLRLWSGSSSTDDSSDFDDAGGARVARRTDDGTTGSNGAMPRLGRNRGGGAAASADLDAPGGSRAGSGEHRLDSRLRRGKAEMITGDRRGGTAGGAVGIGAGTRGGPGAGGSGSVSMHLNGSGTGREGRDSSRSELLDAIASQPKSKSTGEFGGPMGAQTNEPDVLLAVNKPEDTENAVESKNVKPAEDGEGISFKDGSDVAYPADLVNTEAGSISFKLTPETWKGSDATDNSFVQIRDPNQWDNRLQIFRNGIYLRFIFTGSSGFESGISYKIDSWQPGDTHPITATWGDGTISLYVDGQPVGTNKYPDSISFGSGTNMHIGGDVAGGFSSAGGTMGDITVLGRALSPDEITSR